MAKNNKETEETKAAEFTFEFEFRKTLTNKKEELITVSVQSASEAEAIAEAVKAAKEQHSDAVLIEYTQKFKKIKN